MFIQQKLDRKLILWGGKYWYLPNITQQPENLVTTLPGATNYQILYRKKLTYNKKKTSSFFQALDFLQSNAFTPLCVEELSLESKRGLLLGMYSAGRLRNLFL